MVLFTWTSQFRENTFPRQMGLTKEKFRYSSPENLGFWTGGRQDSEEGTFS